MTDNEIRIAVAECCGWTRTYAANNNAADKEKHEWTSPDGLDYPQLPDYPNDLNAMADAEKWMKEQPDHEYSHTSIWSYDEYLRTHFGPRASALERSEAFLRTLGKWKE